MSWRLIGQIWGDNPLLELELAVNVDEVLEFRRKLSIFKVVQQEQVKTYYRHFNARVNQRII